MSQPNTLIEALAVTAELTGTTWSKAAALAAAKELERYPLADVLQALERCRRELKSRLTLAEIIARLSGRHPGPEEAWAMIAPKVASDEPTVFVTDEMREAFGAALALEANLTQARLAFLDVYRAAVANAEAEGRAPHWTMMPGTDPRQREAAVLEAVQRGLVSREWAERYLPVEAHPDLLRLAGEVRVKEVPHARPLRAV